MSTRPARYRVTVHQQHDGASTKIADLYGSAFITAVTTTTPDGGDDDGDDDDDIEVHLHDSGPHLQRYTAQAVADQYLPAKRQRSDNWLVCARERTEPQALGDELHRTSLTRGRPGGPDTAALTKLRA